MKKNKSTVSAFMCLLCLLLFLFEVSAVRAEATPRPVIEFSYPGKTVAPQATVYPINLSDSLSNYVDMLPVDSDTFEEIGYAEESSMLFVRFTSGSVYVYSDVSPEEWDSFQNAESLGDYFNSNIKGAYDCRRIYEGEYAVLKPEQNSEITYIINKNSKKFHKPTCSSVEQMKEKNRVETNETREELMARGLDPCKNCNP